jgi:hypothetical protein
LIPSIAALAITYTLWVNIYGAQPGAYRVIPWIVLVWCCAPIITTFLNPGLLELITSGRTAARQAPNVGVPLA